MNGDAPKKRKRFFPLGLSLFLIGLLVLGGTLFSKSLDENTTKNTKDVGGGVLFPAASTMFGDLTPITVSHAKVRMLAPNNWVLVPKNGLTGKGRGVLALLPKPPVEGELEQTDMPMLFVYNYAEFPIRGETQSSLYEEGMTVMEWALAVALSETFEDAQPPVETSKGDAMFDAQINGDPCVCVLAVHGAPMLMYYRIPYEWAEANTREMEFIKQDLSDIAFSLEATE